MNFDERACSFFCGGSPLYGILSIPQSPLRRGVLVVVGGPQYRAGSHRQFTLLARYLASCGIAVMRFDYRGMGDSAGSARTFEDIDDDIKHAVDHFLASVPAVKEIVIWGLCDAASAALFYAHRDPRISGLVLLNPWIRTEQGKAKTYLRHYYGARLVDPALWKKIVRGQFDFAAAARSLAHSVSHALGTKPRQRSPKQAVTKGDPTSVPVTTLPVRMQDGFDRFRGQVLLILSGNDLTAQEFVDQVRASRKWRSLLAAARVQRRDLEHANHTFSERRWRDQVARWTQEWLISW